MKKKKKEDDLSRRNDCWEDEDRVIRQESSEHPRNSPVKERQFHYAPDVPKSQKHGESDKDHDSGSSQWDYS